MSWKTPSNFLLEWKCLEFFCLCFGRCDLGIGCRVGALMGVVGGFGCEVGAWVPEVGGFRGQVGA